MCRDRPLLRLKKGTITPQLNCVSPSAMNWGKHSTNCSGNKILSCAAKETPSENERILICDFSRGVLNTRSTRSYPTLAPRPQIRILSFSEGWLWQLSQIQNLFSRTFYISCLLPQILPITILIQLSLATVSPEREKLSYICGLRTRIECEPEGANI